MENLKNTQGVTVKFEELDDNDNIIRILSEKTFPDAKFSSWMSPGYNLFLKYRCFDKDVIDYVYHQHCMNNQKYDYSNWEEAPNIRQAFYNADGELMYTDDEVDYEMNL